MASKFDLIWIILALVGAALAQPQTNPEKIWGSVVFTVPGDSPLINSPPTLSALGQQQAMLAGSTIRRRYIDGEGNNVTGVARISRLAKNGTKDILDHKMLDIMSTDDQRDVGAALSFMQGLYPPLSGQRGSRDMIQWPSISAVTKDDYKFNWLAGANECSAHAINRASYTGTKPYNDTQYATFDYYQSLKPYFPQLPPQYLAYTNAPTISSIADYMRENNGTFAKLFSAADVAYLRSLASQHIWDNYGRYSQGNSIPVIGGRMLAGSMLGHLTNHITSSTTGAPLSLLFGPAESLISFYSISGLAAKGQEFRQLPLPGTSLVLEVFSEGTEDPLKSRVLLDSSKLFVRALMRNGTLTSEALNSVPLFYRGGPAGIKIPWREFSKAMTQIAVQSPADWCTQCKSLSIFCAGFLAGSDTTKKTGENKNCPEVGAGKGCGKVSPTAAGFIGALVATVLFIAAIAMLAYCTGGKLAAWRKRRLDDTSEAAAAAGTAGNKTGLFGWVKRKSITKKEKRNSDPDVADSIPGKMQPKTNSWELRSSPNAAGMPVLVNTIPARGTADESTRPSSPVSPLERPSGEIGADRPGQDRLRSTQDYSKRDADDTRDEEAAAAGLGRVEERHLI